MDNLAMARKRNRLQADIIHELLQNSEVGVRLLHELQNISSLLSNIISASGEKQVRIVADTARAFA